MARYVDMYVLQRRICGAKCGCEYEQCGCEGDCAFDLYNLQVPTADVAPRAEVAREIFEEIKRLVDVYLDGELQFIGALEDLKKKYSEKKPH